MIQFYGIRHHGPGSARSVLKALQEKPPDVLLVEGPPDAEALLHFLMDKAMKPPVALLIYAEQDLAQAVYYPFVQFSPEYQAIRFALEHQIPVRLMDLPQRYMMVLRKSPSEVEEVTNPEPLRELARAAGYEDPERWWDAMVEQRRDTTDFFNALHEAMTVLREIFSTEDPLEKLREAYMRRIIYQAQEEGFQQIGVVCGAWHTPALKDCVYTNDDEILLAELTETPVAATWIPWTFSRLSRYSGYGAGVESPGWYRFLWQTEDHRTIAAGWMTKIAHHLRKHDLNASTAQVIDAVRLVETLAALRRRPTPDLYDMNEAALSVLCHGNEAPMQIIHRDLIVGKAIGRVPKDVPIVPLQRDFYSHVERFDLQIGDEESERILDLRDEPDRELSRFLYRLQLLDIQWGKLEDRDAVYEFWTLQWDPLMVIQLIEKGAWGNSIYEASTEFIIHQAAEIVALPALTRLAGDVLLADLPDAIPMVIKHLQDQAAGTGDISQLMEALPSLVNALIYGDIRHTHQDILGRIVDGMTARIMIGLPAECMAVDDDRAVAMMKAMTACDVALRLLDDSAVLNDWYRLLRRLSDQKGIHGLVRGCCCRILLDADYIEKAESVRLMRLALARIVPPLEAAAWLRGFLEESAAILIHDDTLLDVVDIWVASLAVDDFEMILPLLRRIFATFEEPEIRSIGQRVMGKQPRIQSKTAVQIDPERAGQVDAAMDELLGRSKEQ